MRLRTPFSAWATRAMLPIRSTRPLSAGRENMPTAWRFFKTPIARIPAPFGRWSILVNGYVQSGQISQAETFIRSVLTDNPANAEALVLMGSIQLAKNAPAQAEKYFKSAIEKKPADAAGYRALAELYARQKKPDEALNLVRAGAQAATQ